MRGMLYILQTQEPTQPEKDTSVDNFTRYCIPPVKEKTPDNG